MIDCSTFLLSVGIILILALILAIPYLIRTFSLADWISCAIFSVGTIILLLGYSRVHSKSGYHSGLHGIPILEQTEPWHPFFPVVLFAVALIVGFMGPKRKPNNV